MVFLASDGERKRREGEGVLSLRHFELSSVRQQYARHPPPCHVMTCQENAQGGLQSSLSVALRPASGYSQGGALPKGHIHPFNKGLLWILINSFCSEF